MSRAFTKETAPEGPLIIPPRAPLPAGVPNYVTPRGLTLLKEERTALEAEREQLGTLRREEEERKRQRKILNGRLADLNARLASARVVDPRRQAHDAVRFGATVTLRTVGDDGPGEERRITIVGVDEAGTRDDYVAFTSPIARVLTGKQVGDRALLETARGEETLEITAIVYETA